MTPDISLRSRRWLILIGRLLGMVSLVFVAYKFYTYYDEIKDDSIGLVGWVGVFFLALLFGVINILLSEGWRSILFFWISEYQRRLL